MRKLKACVQIKAPVQTVRSLTDPGRRHHWLAPRGGVWVRTLDERWEATEWEGGTRLSLQLQYQSRVPFLEGWLTSGVQQNVANSLTRLKHLAETDPHL